MTADQKRRLARLAVATLAILITIGQPRLTAAAGGQPLGGATATAAPDQTAAPGQASTPAALSATVPAALPCLDDYEGDGIAATAKTILPGERQAHLFCPAGDADWLRFFASAGKGYLIAATPLSSAANSYFYLFAPDGSTVLASSDGTPPRDGQAQMVFYPALDDWYFAQFKNGGDVGLRGLGYSVSLSIVDAPSSTPTIISASSLTATATGTPTASSTATTAPATAIPTSAAAPSGVSPFNVAESTPVMLVVTATPLATAADDLLRPEEGGAGSGGLPVFDAGSADALQPDKLEPNNTFVGAVAMNVGAVYQHLNFVPAAGADADGDFYSFRAKPALCYQVQTGDLSPGLDTTILLWQAGATREERRLVAQNDDAHPKTADLSSSVRWCSATDGFMVVELHNYGWAPETDPRGKSYSLAVLIDPPTPTPTRTARPADAGAVATSGDVAGGRSPAPGATNGASAGGSSAALPAPATQPPAPPPLTATSTVTAIATATAAVSTEAAIASPTSSPTGTPTMTITATATATPIPTAVADLTCYLDLNQNEAPDPGEGIADLRGVVIDTTTNAVIVAARSDDNGHIHLVWPGRASVRIALPDLGWNQEVLAGQLQRGKDEPLGGGHWSADVRVKAPALPGILP